MDEVGDADEVAGVEVREAAQHLLELGGRRRETARVALLRIRRHDLRLVQSVDHLRGGAARHVESARDLVHGKRGAGLGHVEEHRLDERHGGHAREDEAPQLVGYRFAGHRWCKVSPR